MSVKAGEGSIGVSVVFFITDGIGNFAFLKRGENCRDEKGVWEVGAGQVEFMERLQQALEREVWEEYGVDIQKSYLLGHVEMFRGQTHWIAFCYKVTVDPYKVRIVERDKFMDLCWSTLDDLPTPTHSQLPRIVEAFRDKLDNLGG